MDSRIKPTGDKSKADVKASDSEAARQRVARLEALLGKLQKNGKQEQAMIVLARLEKVRKVAVGTQVASPSVNQSGIAAQGPVQPSAPSSNQVSIAPLLSDTDLIRQAYLRSVSRPPTETELARAQQHLRESPNHPAGLRDLLWALLNTKEFIVNH